MRPQKIYYNEKGQKEIVNVAIAQHPNWEIGMSGSEFYGNKGNWGCSYRDGSHGDPENDIVFGYNFQEQWDFALKQDVPFIFITGWNEWVAGRWKTKDGDSREHSRFVDLASPGFSRDAEPSLTGGIKDNYYMQMVANIRRYKGIERNSPAGPKKTIRRFSDWKDIVPVYTDYIYDTQARNHPGAQSNPAITYINETGRNDFHLMKVSRDRKNIFFYAETNADITENSGSNWMRLYLNVDRKETGWLGYDFRVVEGDQLQKYLNCQWTDFIIVDFTVQENKFMVTIPLEYLNSKKNVLDLEFKWSDNMQDDKDPLDWYVNGDVAPGGRFNFIYSTD